MARRRGGRTSRGGSTPKGARKGARLREVAPIAALVGLAFAVLAGLAVLPARTWLTQRESMAQARDELQQIETEVAVLSAQLEELQTDAEIERLAREHFDLVYPGEESYRIVPAEP